MEEVQFTSYDFEQMERRFRAHFFNSLSGYKSVNLCGTCSKNERSNLAVFNSIFHIGSNPPLLGMIIRPATVPRHTLTNIIEQDHYTFNHIHEDIVKPAHQTSAKYTRTQSEFDLSGLTPFFSDEHPAPYVAESRIKIGLKFRERYNIQANHTIMIVGEVVEVIVPKDVVGIDGFIDLCEAGTVAGSGLDAYLNTDKITRLSYARPYEDLREIEYAKDKQIP